MYLLFAVIGFFAFAFSVLCLIGSLIAGAFVGIIFFSIIAIMLFIASRRCLQLRREKRTKSDIAKILQSNTHPTGSFSAQSRHQPQGNNASGDLKTEAPPTFQFRQPCPEVKYRAPEATPAITVPPYIRGSKLVYHYENVELDFPNIEAAMKTEFGKAVSFVQEKENPHDINTISVWCEGMLLGYMKDTNIRDMIHDWMERNDIIHSFYQCRSEPGEADMIGIFLGFYRNEVEMAKRGAVSITSYTLVGNSKKTMQESIGSMYNENTELWVDYDSDKSQYLVYTHNHGDLGYLPKKPELSEGALDGARVFFKEKKYIGTEKQTLVVDVYL